MRFLMGFVVAGMLASGVGLGQQYKVGDEVVVVQEREIRSPAGKVDKVFPGLVLKVEDIKGRLLWVENGKPGWLDSANVIPLDGKAIDRISALIRSQPGSSSLYHARSIVWSILVTSIKRSLTATRQYD